MWFVRVLAQVPVKHAYKTLVMDDAHRTVLAQCGMPDLSELEWGRWFVFHMHVKVWRKVRKTSFTICWEITWMPKDSAASRWEPRGHGTYCGRISLLSDKLLQSTCWTLFSMEVVLSAYKFKVLLKHDPYSEQRPMSGSMMVEKVLKAALLIVWLAEQ